MSTTPIGDKFRSIPAEEQWEFIVNMEDRSGIQMMLDNDGTSIYFGEKDKDGEHDWSNFRDDIGNNAGAFMLLSALGISAIPC